MITPTLFYLRVNILRKICFSYIQVEKHCHILAICFQKTGVLIFMKGIEGEFTVQKATLHSFNFHVKKTTGDTLFQLSCEKDNRRYIVSTSM